MILIYACDGLFKPSALLCIQPFSCLCFIPSNNYYTFVRNSDKFSSTADIYPSPPPSISFHPTSIHKESQSLVLHKMIAERTFSSLLHTAVSPDFFASSLCRRVALPFLSLLFLRMHLFLLHIGFYWRRCTIKFLFFN